MGAAACGGDDNGDDAGAPADPPTADDGASDNGDAPDPASRPSGNGSGAFVVDDKTFEFDVVFCGFTPEETRNGDVPFSFRGSGSDNGRDYSIDGTILRLEVGSVVSESHDLEMWYDDDPTNSIYNTGVLAGAVGDDQPEWVIEDKQVSFEGAFGNSTAGPVGTGTLVATCP